MKARTLLLCLVTIAVVMGSLVWDRYDLRRRVEDLGTTDRHVVFESTIAGFRRLCVDGRGEGFEGYCGTQRDFLELFPECDTGCRRLLAKVERAPTR